MIRTRPTARGGALALAFVLAAAIAVMLAAATSAQTPTNEPSGSEEMAGTFDAAQLLQTAESEGSVRVIVGLDTNFTPEGRLSGARIADQRDGIESTGDELRGDLAGTGFRTLREYETVPYIALRLSPEALEEAQNSPLTTTIQEDVAVPATLAESTPIVQAPTMWANGFTGAGQTIAVLDTGTDGTHPFLAGKVVEEACYSGNSDCPNNMTTQTGAGSGVPCTYAASGCRHGTHVSGIAAGDGTTFDGVARGANVMAVQVFSEFTGQDCIDGNQTEDPCTLTFTSDQIEGLERVYDLRNTHTFSSVNMSLGGGMNTSNCDTDSRKTIIDNLRSEGIATVIAAGNSGFTNALGAPACISSAISVGSTTDSDTISSFSNMASFISLLAPGSSIDSSVPGTGFANFNGTSMAAPHVAGAWALLEQQDTSRNVPGILTLLQNTGTSVTDGRMGGTVTAQRINIGDAADVDPPNVAPSFTSGPDETVNEDAGLQTVAAWATNISPGPANESSQTVTFNVTNDDNALFSTQPAVASDGTLTYTPAPDANGGATVSVVAKDDGGTAIGGDDESDAQNFTITVNEVNDEPSFTKGPDQSVIETAGPQTVTGWATAISKGPANESSQNLDFVVTNDDNALFSTQPAVDASGTLTFTPAPRFDGMDETATVSVKLRDDGGTANGGDDESDIQTFTITSKTACTIVGTSGNNNIQGTNGDDVICGLGGNDHLHGRDGNDLLAGGGGNDHLHGDKGDDELLGGDNDDRLDGADGDDDLDGGSGVNDMKGGQGNDTITGGPDRDDIKGDQGNDTATGGAGNDDIKGGPGDDSLDGGSGADHLKGDPGKDNLNAQDGVMSNDDVDGGPDTDTCQADAGDKVRGCP